MAQFGDFQRELARAGAAGRLPRYPLDYATLQQRGAEALPDWVASYLAAGAGDESTQRANVDVFSRWGLLPRMLNGAHDRDLSVDLFGVELPSPLFMCPIGAIGICSSDLHGDFHVARAAAETGVPMVASTLSQDPLEDVAQLFAGTPGFFQLYTPTDRDLALSLIGRAERAGFAALVITLDTWIPGWRPSDLNTGKVPPLLGYGLANYVTDPHFRKRLDVSPEADPAAVIAEWATLFGNCLSWDDVTWIRDATTLPIVLKGIGHPEDVRKAKDFGIDGIYCSNHGGRQANGGLPALQMLPGVVHAADGLPVMFDSGVRSGTDVVKALALGADAVGIGRPYAYALAGGGGEGLIHYLRSVLAEADLLMAVDGYPDIASLRATRLERLW